jgi:hypothetical protein
MALGSTQAVAEMSTRNLPGAEGPVREADLTDISEPTVQKMYHKPMVLHGLLQEYLSLLLLLLLSLPSSTLIVYTVYFLMKAVSVLLLFQNI